jgi:hypothetical protein
MKIKIIQRFSRFFLRCGQRVNRGLQVQKKYRALVLIGSVFLFSSLLHGFALPESLLQLFDRKIYWTNSGSVFNQKKYIDLLLTDKQFWASYPNILVLGDGVEKEEVTLGNSLHRAFPRLEVVKSSLAFKTVSSHDHKLFEIPLHHTHQFSKKLPPHYFDAVIMLRGLCHCQSPATLTCGGLNTSDLQEMKKFVRNVVETVNWSNANAFAYLHGKHKSKQSPYWKWVQTGQQKARHNWEKVLRDVLKKNKNMDGELVIDENDLFHGLLLYRAD